MCFEEEMEGRYNEEKNIVLDDSSQYFVDYKKEIDSILYVNNKGRKRFFSYIKGCCIYNRERKEIEEITECDSSDHQNTYQWVSLEEVYILCREDSWTSLYQ